MKIHLVFLLVLFLGSLTCQEDSDIKSLKEELELLKETVKILLERDKESTKEVESLKNEIKQLKDSEKEHKNSHEKELKEIRQKLQKLERGNALENTAPSDSFEDSFFDDEKLDLFDENNLSPEEEPIDPFLDKELLQNKDLFTETEKPVQNETSIAELEIEDDFGEEDETEFYLRNSNQINEGFIEEQTRRLTNGGLTISGFFSLEYNDFQSSDSTVEVLFPSESTFNNSHINLYFDARFYDSFRFFTELRFVYQPFTEVFELGQVNRSSEVIIERAWAEWEYRDWLNVRVGTFFIPYGIWNLEHGSPVLLSTFTPILLRRQIFPERTTGIEINGLVDMGTFDLKYYAWVGNGKTQIEEAALPTQDNQNNKAFGGRLEFQFPYTNVFRELAFGISGYIGKVQGQEFNGAAIQNLIAQVFIEEGNQAVLVDLEQDGFSAVGEPLDEYWDQAVGIDFRFRLHNFSVQSEFIVNFVDPSKAAVGPITGQTVKGNSFREYGGYMQFAYEVDINKYGATGLLTPFARLGIVQANDRAAKELGSFNAYTFGLNWKVNPAVVLKAEYNIIKFADVGDRDFGAFISSFNVSF